MATGIRVGAASTGMGIGVASVVIVAGWALSIVAQLTGSAGLLHHHTLIEGGVPLWLAIPLFLVGWQVMLAAMMLPASLPAIRIAGLTTVRPLQPGGWARGRADTAFILAFAVVWSVFGVLAFSGDFVLHHVVDATPWLAAHPWLIEGGVLILAGLYQWTPIKRRSLELCRHPMELLVQEGEHGAGSARLGIDHGLACLGSSWALMLLTFAEGFANLGWMAALTAVMVYETTGRRGTRVATLAGLGLVLLGIPVLAGLAGGGGA
jgi:predicted metal-binding membrane protein